MNIKQSRIYKRSFHEIDEKILLYGKAEILSYQDGENEDWG